MNETSGKVPAESGQRLVSMTHFVSHGAGSASQMVWNTPSIWSTNQFWQAFVLSGDVGLIHRLLLVAPRWKEKPRWLQMNQKSELESKALQEGEDSIGQEAEILMPLCTFFNPTAWLGADPFIPLLHHSFFFYTLLLPHYSFITLGHRAPVDFPFLTNPTAPWSSRACDLSHHAADQLLEPHMAVCSSCLFPSNLCVDKQTTSVVLAALWPPN